MNDPNMPLCWNQFFMGVAELAARRSKDPVTKVGACIVDSHQRIVATGYNSMPSCPNNDQTFPWVKEGAFLETKYAYVVHAEANAILNAVTELHNTTLFVTKFPCHECAKLIAQSGIKTVLYKDSYEPVTDSMRASNHIFDSCGIDVYVY